MKNKNEQIWQSERELASAEISGLLWQLEGATEACTREQIALRDATEELARVQGDLRETREALRAQEYNVSSAGDANAKLKKELDEKTLELDAIRVTVASLENEMVRQCQAVIAKEELLQETTRLKEENEVKLQERLLQIAQLEASAKELEAETLEMKDKDEQRFASACAQLNELEDDANRFQVDLVKVENERDTLADQVVQLQQTLEENEVKLQERLHQIAQLEATTKELEAETLEMKDKDEQRFASACAQLNELEDDANRFQVDLVKVENERDTLADQVVQLQQALESALVERGDMEVVHFWSQEKLAASEQQANSLQAELNMIQATHLATVDKCLELDGHIRTLQNEKIPSIENKFTRDLLDTESTLAHLLTEMDRTLLSFRRESENTDVDSSELRKDFISPQHERYLFGSAGDPHRHQQLGHVRDELETVTTKSPDQERDPISLQSSDKTSGILLRCKELEDALHLIRTACHSIRSDRDSLKSQLTDLQEKLGSTETNYTNLRLQSESAFVKFQEEIGASAIRMTEFEQEHQQLKSDYLSLGAEKDVLQEELCKARDDLATGSAMLAQQPTELVSVALIEKDEAMTSVCRGIELEDTLQVVREEHRTVLYENQYIASERDELKRQLTELQEKLNSAETNCFELHIQLESAQLRFHEEIGSSELQIKELEQNIQQLQSEYQSLGRERDILQKELNGTEEELMKTRAMMARQPAELISAVEHEQEEAMASINRVTELEDTVQVLLEERQVLVKESDNFRKALEVQQRERDSSENHLIGQIDHDELNFSQRQVELENTIIAADIRNESLTEEVNKLRSAFKLVEQANESHQERLALTQMEVTKLEELLDEATVLLAEAMEQKDSLQRTIVSAPGDIAINKSKPVLGSSERDAQGEV